MPYLILSFFRVILVPLLYASSSFLTTSSINFGFEKSIGYVEVKGVITEGVRKETVGALEKFRRSRNVRAIVLRIDCPGGGTAATQEIYSAVKRVRATGKPIFASMGSVAASGGYYIAIPCDKIFANPSTVTGSIGVIMEIPNIEGLLRKIGVYFMVVKSDEHKDIGSPFRKMTEVEEKLIKDVIDDVYNQFVDAIVLDRGIKKEDVLKIADGRIITGKQAKELGFIDELGNLQDVIREAAKAAGLGERPKIVKQKKKKLTLLELLGMKSFIEENINSLKLEYR